MGARVDSDDDAGGKAISKKETRMLLAINSAESLLIDAMEREMHDSGSTFDVEKFVDVFRKYTPHFVQMMSAESSEDSDEEDERPLPKKYLPFLSAFAKARDGFVAAIKNNYKVLCNKDLKDINFSVFKSHPEEIFKSYDKCGGRQTKANAGSAAPHQLQFNTQQTFSSFGNDMVNIDDSVDTDHGSLLSGQEEELRRTIESESDTPTPTIEDWNGARERRKSIDRANDVNKSRCAVPDAVPLMVPSRGQKTEYCRPLSTSLNMDQHRREMGHISENDKEEVTSVETTRNHSHLPIFATDCDASIVLTSFNSLNSRDGTSAQPDGTPSSSNLDNDEMVTATPLISRSQSNSSLSRIVPAVNQSPYGSSNMANVSVHISTMNMEGLTEKKDTSEEELSSVMTGLKDTVKKVHQDVRFALPPMIERVLRAYIHEKRPITVKELIGEEYADDSLEKFMLKMLSTDATLMKILVLNSNDEGVPVVHLQENISMQIKKSSNISREEKIEKADSLEEIGMDSNIVPSTPERLTAIDHHQFYPESFNLPMPLLKNGGDVNILYNGSFAVVLSKWTPTIEAQLEALRKLDIDHLSLSSERHLEKGRAVVLKSDVGTFCRGIIADEWTRDVNATEVNCMLIDFGDVHPIPIDAIYAFPKWTETIPPASILMGKLKCYPLGARLETDEFSDSEWNFIGKLLNEWKKNDVNIHIMSLEGDRYVIDLENEQGDSFTHQLIKMAIVKKELISCDTVSSASLSADMPTNSVDEQPDPLVSRSTMKQNENELLSASCVEKILDDTSNTVDSRDLHEKNASQFGADGSFNEQVKDTTELVSVNKINENIGEDWVNVMERKNDSDYCLTIPSSMNVMNVSSMTTSSSLIVRKDESNIRDFLEVPSSAGIPSLLQFVAQPIPNTPPPLIGLNIRRSGLVQVLDDNE